MFNLWYKKKAEEKEEMDNMKLEMESIKDTGMDDIQSNRGQDTDTTDQFEEKEGEEDMDGQPQQSNDVVIEDFEDIKNDFEIGFRAARKPRLVSNQ